jgi:hypothetical protein
MVDQHNADYHADTSKLSASMLAIFRESPAKYHATYVAETIAKPPATDAMRFGSAFHCAVLEPERFAIEYHAEPGISDKRTKKWAAMVDSVPDKVCLAYTEMETIAGMADAVWHHDMAVQILAADAIIEEPVYWVENGINSKCKPDILIADKDGGVALDVDLKSCSDSSPRAFRKSGFNYGYFRASDWYRRGVEATTGLRHRRLFIAVCKSPPYDVWVYDCREADLDEAREQNDKDLAWLATCRESGVWRAEGQLGITEL